MVISFGEKYKNYLKIVAEQTDNLVNELYYNLNNSLIKIPQNICDNSKLLSDKMDKMAN